VAYIVVLREGSETDLIAREHAARYGFEVQHLYHAALNGYAGRLDSAVAERLSGDARVAYVSPDFEVQAPVQPGDSVYQYPGTVPPYLFGQQAPYGVQRIEASSDGKTQTLTHTGAGIGVGVIDTGIQLNHPDLTPVLSGKNCVNQNVPPDDDAGTVRTSRARLPHATTRSGLWEWRRVRRCTR